MLPKLNVLFVVGVVCLFSLGCSGGTDKDDIIVVDDDDPPALASGATDPFSIAEWFLGQPGNAERAARSGPRSYAGALDPAGGDWTQGWTATPGGNGAVWKPATEGTLGGEVPTADGTCPAGTMLEAVTTLPAGYPGEMDVCRLATRYDVDGDAISLTNDNVYRLGSSASGGTFVGDGDFPGKDDRTAVEVSLLIEAGTLILGDSSEALAITRNSSLSANGSVANPVVMGSVGWFESWTAGVGADVAVDDWGGLVMSGFAGSTACTGASTCDGRAADIARPFFYGGDDDDDGSGRLRYVVVLDAGIDFYGVGRATEVSHVHVHRSPTDGIQLGGGAVDIDHAVLTASGASGLTWGYGFRGSARFVVIEQQDGGMGGVGLQGAGPDVEAEATSDSDPTLTNLTLIGNHEGADGPTLGMLLKNGARGFVRDSIVEGFDFCLDLDGDATFEAAEDGQLGITGTVVSCEENYVEE